MARRQVREVRNKSVEVTLCLTIRLDDCKRYALPYDVGGLNAAVFGSRGDPVFVKARYLLGAFKPSRNKNFVPQRRIDADQAIRLCQVSHSLRVYELPVLPNRNSD